MSSVRNLVILQARMSSRRLPGKVLMPLNGEPMIQRQIARILESHEVDNLIVATSTDPSDDALVDYLNSKGVMSFRGSLDDVFSRFYAIIQSEAPEVIVRLTADCPLVMPKILDEMLCQFHVGGSDYMSNALHPTYPDGLDIEIFSRECFRKLSALSLTPEELEHVTLGINNRKDFFKIENYSDIEDNSKLRWTVDYIEDFEFIKSVYANFQGREKVFTYQDVLNFVRLNPGIVSKISWTRRNESLKRP
jgi:spore coat polysaccharide biosynthesis protein SpsF